jgi:hypothetical protein
MITVCFRVTAVARRTSSEVNTIYYTYESKKESENIEGELIAVPKRKDGAEWEEVEFSTIREEKPTVQVANIAGNVFLPSSPVKLIINNPDLFGTYKVGDIIDFMPKNETLSN